MNFAFKLFSAIVPAAGLLFASISFPQIASASISCQARTASNYPNGSLVTCILDRDTVAGVENNSFHCKQGQYIAFDERGQFKSCILSEELQIRRDAKISVCPANYRISVEIAKDGRSSINCG